MNRLITLTLLQVSFILSTVSGQGMVDQPYASKEDSIKAEIINRKKEIAAALANVKVEYMLVNAANNQFGYFILLDGQIYIEQKTIPAIQGMHGFHSKEEAVRVAQLVIEKLKQGEVPPAVTSEDLAALRITLPSEEN